jgi:mono/diheme cytochrome c family protein
VRRPVAIVAALLVIASMGILTYKGATAKESLAGENVALIPDWQTKQDLSEKGVAGANIFARAGCMNCHTYLGAGSSNLGAPDLTAEGAKGKGKEFQIEHLKCPSCVTPGSPMPAFPDFTDEQYDQLATFLEESKGGGGGG